MAATSGAQEEQDYQQWRGAPSTSPDAGQASGSTDEDSVQNIEIPYSEPPSSSISDCASRFQNNEKHNFSKTEHEQKAKCRTSENPDCKLHLKSPSGRESRSRSREPSRKRSRSPSVSSCSSSRSRSRSRSSNRSAARSRDYRRRYRRSSRSSSRSRSRSLTPRCRRHPSSYYRSQCSSSFKRYHRSPRKYRSRSRSRSHVRAYYGRCRSQSRSRSRSRSRKHYRFVRRAYPASFRSWRGRSRTRSRSRSQSRLRLTEEDRQKLLEIAKANAAKTLGKSVDLPPSLKKDSCLTNTLQRSFEADSGKQSPNLIDAVPTKVSPQQGANLLSTDRAVVPPVLDKEGNKLARSLKKDEAKKAPGQWIPIQCQRNVLNRLQ